jgi:hypothetical protein
MTRIRTTRWLVLGLAFCAAQCTAAEGPGLENVRACAALHADAERLPCFDREVARLGPASSTVPASTIAPVAAAAPGAASVAPAPRALPTPEQSFGLPPAKLNERYPAPAGSEPLRQLTARVVSVRELPLGNYVIELDNGQTWRQIDTYFNLRLRPGAEITIKPGAIGSYWLSAAGRGAHVKRIR